MRSAGGAEEAAAAVAGAAERQRQQEEERRQREEQAAAERQREEHQQQEEERRQREEKDRRQREEGAAAAAGGRAPAPEGSSSAVGSDATATELAQSFSRGSHPGRGWRGGRRRALHGCRLRGACRLNSDDLYTNGSAGGSEADPSGSVKASASSFHEPELTFTYGEPSTTWNAKGTGERETLNYRFRRPVHLVRVGLLNGYVGSRPETYFQNARLQDVTLVTEEDDHTWTLAGADDWAEVERRQYLRRDLGTMSWVRLVVDSVYEGTDHNDAAVSEIRFWERPPVSV
jgi:hypothetical protein